VVNDKSLLTTFVNPCPNYTMGKINGFTNYSEAKILGYGSMEPLGNALYAPQVIANLISVSQLTDNGFEVRILGDRCISTKSNSKHESSILPVSQSVQNTN